MKRSKTLITLLAVLPIGGVLALQNPYADDLAAARQALERYSEIDVAIADGFERLFECISGERGAMGVHYIHPGRVDNKLVLAEPEVLMYEPQSDGSMKLVSVEHIVFEKDWTNATPPQFLGRTLKRKTTVGAHPVDPFYEIHVWHWRDNPNGRFADWNPQVSCQHG